MGYLVRVRGKRCRYALVVLCALVPTLLAGCIFTWKPTAEVRIPQDVGRIPLRVGVFLPPKLASLEYLTPTDLGLKETSRGSLSDNPEARTSTGARKFYKMPVGLASAELFRAGLPRLFEQVQFVAKDGPDDRYDFVLIPWVSVIQAEVSGTRRSASIEYTVDIIDRTGSRTVVRSGRGDGEHRVNILIRLIMLPVYLATQVLTFGGYDQASSDFQDAFSQAQTEAFRKLATRLPSVPVIARAVEAVHAERNLARLAPSRESLEEQVARLTGQLLQGLDTGTPHRIAIAGFTPVQGPPTQFQAYLSEELVTRLSATKLHTVVERSLLDKAMAELHLNQSDLVDPKQAKALGKLTGADAVLVGTTAALDQDVRVTARVVETETGTVLAAATVSIFQHEAVRLLLERKMEGSAP